MAMKFMVGDYSTSPTEILGIMINCRDGTNLFLRMEFAIDFIEDPPGSQKDSLRLHCCPIQARQKLHDSARMLTG